VREDPSPPDAAGTTPRITAAIAAAVLAVLVAAVFGGTLGNEFVFDDHDLVEGNPVVRTLDPRTHFGSHFWEQQGGTGAAYLYYRPLVSLTLAVEWKLFETRPFGYHLTNLLLHAAAAFLVFLVARGLGSDVAALIAAALFAVHSAQTEAVAFVLARTDLLAACLVLLGAWLHARAGRASRFGAVAAFGAALLSKEAAITFPALVLGIEWARARAAGQPLRALWAPGSRLRAALPYYAALIAGYLVLRFAVLGRLLSDPSASGETWRNPVIGAGLAERLMTAVNVAFRYLQLALFPRDLSADWQFEAVPLVETPGAGTFWLPLVVVALAAVLAVRLARRSPLALFGALTAIGAYSLVSHVAFVAPVVLAERFLYLPMVGLCALAAAAIDGLRQALRKPRVVALGIAALLVVPLAIRSRVRIADWRDDRTLFAAAVETTPRSALAWNNLGFEQLEADELEAAAVSFDEALSIAPFYRSARINLATVERRRGRLGVAEALLREAARDHPEAGEVWLALIPLLGERADALDADGRAAEARTLRAEAVDLARTQAARAEAEGAWGGAAVLRVGAAASLERLGDVPAAEAEFARAVAATDRELAEGDAVDETAQKVRAAVLFEYARFLSSRGRVDEAAARLAEAREAALRSGDPELAAGMPQRPVSSTSGLIARAEAAFEQGRSAEALGLYDQALAAEPDSLRGLHGRGRTRLALGDLDGAESDLRAVVAAGPGARVTAAAWTDLAIVAASREDGAEVLRRLDAAVAADATFGLARYHRGMLYLQGGESQRAEAELEAAIDTALPAPAAAECWFRLAQLARARGDETAAEERIARCLALRPDHPGALALRDTPAR
jgi:tetratricopeptide (TPR) repeat protein